MTHTASSFVVMLPSCGEGAYSTEPWATTRGGLWLASCAGPGAAASLGVGLDCGPPRKPLAWLVHQTVAW